MSTTVGRGAACALAFGGVVGLSCCADRGNAPAPVSADADTSAMGVEAVVESPAAATRVAELRERFRVAVRSAEDLHAGLAPAVRAERTGPTARPALGTSAATRFEAAPGADAATHLRAVLPSEALRSVTRVARVALPLRADGEVVLEDATSRLAVRFALEHVQNARVEVTDGMALYRGALDGADVVHRVHAEGTEDFVVFERRPARAELRYSVDVSRVPGLRLVSNTLEFLDESGTPLLRVAPPYVVDAQGARHEARLAVSGCAYDTNPAGPWGRAATSPGAERCGVRVAWGGDVSYPALVDPAWTTTGSMATARQEPSASVLLSGKVLVVGGYNDVVSSLASAELYDPAGNAGAGTFAATGAMATARIWHTASVLGSGKVLVAGGYNGTSVKYASAELYDPAGTFAAAASLAATRCGHTASVLGSGKVLVVGGIGATPTLASAEVYDPAGNAGAGSFGATGSLVTARNGHTANVLLSGKVLVAGGFNAGPLASTELYDPAGNAGAGSFAATGSLVTARSGHTASVLPAGKVLIAGGSGGSVALASAELFDPAGAGSFSATGSMATGRARHAASALPGGKVLIAGGTDLAATLMSAELFDPAGNAGAGTFAATGAMIHPRQMHSASLLPSGKVLVAGGGDDGAASLASAEVISFLPAGSACALGGECASSFCADGLCCDAACTGGPCDRCDLPGKQGTCSVAPPGNVGANPACDPYACDGANVVCPKICVADAGCAAGSYCAADGTCQARKSQAAKCDGCGSMATSRMRTIPAGCVA